jgi:deoxyxylulose-5-phosphate synthase
MTVLETIHSPPDLRCLTHDQLVVLAWEICQFLVDQVCHISGYPSRAESVHDLVENSHASTALSYADGLAKAYTLRGETSRAVVAVVGDGALTGGMCWEALNNIAAAKDRALVIVVNDKWNARFAHYR